MTCEIARSDDATPPGWRLSVATIDRNGPFSDFTGCDRTIVPIEGSGFVLAFGDGRAACLDQLFEPFAFAGEERVECTLLAGRSRDFNVITRRDAWRHEVRRVDFAVTPEAIDLPADAFLFAGGALTARAGGVDYRVDPGDTLAAAEPGALTVTAPQGGVALIVTLRRR